MKKYKRINATARIQDYLRDPVNLYFLVITKLDDDVYKFSRKIGCRSYRESDGIHKGMIFKCHFPLYTYKYGYKYNRSLKTRKRLCKNTLRTQAERRDF